MYLAPVAKWICIQLHWYSANQRTYFLLFHYAVHSACTTGGFTQGGCTLLLPRNLDQQAEAAVVGSGSAAPFDAILGFGKPQK